MFALIAAILFFLDILTDSVGPVPLMPCGLFALSLHLCTGIGVPWKRGG